MREQHRRREPQRAAPHGGYPGEDLDPGGHGDDHGRGSEVGLHVHAHADRIHVVRPDHEADHADRDHGVGHAEIAEDRLAREGRDDLADDAEGRQNHDVDFGMAEEPEQVLEEDRVAAALGHKERGAEVAVGEQHGDGTGEHRHGEKQQERGHQHRPYEQRHLVHGHAGRAHVEDRGDEVDRTQERAGAGQMQGKYAHVDRGVGVADDRGQRRIGGPAAAEAAGERREDQQGERRHDQPEADVVEPRERHVGRPDHQRHHPVAEAADQRRHDEEKDHGQAVRGDQHIEHVVIAAEDLVARHHQLGTEHHRHEHANDAGTEREAQIERADVLVVGRIEPAPPPGRGVGVMVVGGDAVGHDAAVPQLAGCAGAGAVATRTSSSSARAKLVCACATHASKSGLDMAWTVIGMKPWLTPHSSEHWP